MSNAEKMVMVPREPTEAMLIAGDGCGIGTPEQFWKAMIEAAPVQQHHGEPVALPARKNPSAYPLPMDAARGYGWNHCLDEIAKLGPLYSRPAHGSPVAWVHPIYLKPGALGFEATVFKLADAQVPLYTHADPAEASKWRNEAHRFNLEVEHLRQFKTSYMEWLDKTDWVQQTVATKELGMHRADVIKQRFDTLRAQLAELQEAFTESQEEVVSRGKMLAEAQALLREVGDSGFMVDGQIMPSHEAVELHERVEAYVSASAEPSAPTPMPAYMEEVCDKFDWTPEEALRFYAEGKHFDTDNGRTRILCTGAIASHALKGMIKEYADLKGSEQGEPSAPVEIDDPCKWSDRQVLEFLGVALRNVDLQGEVRLSEIRQGFEYMRGRATLASKS